MVGSWEASNPPHLRPDLHFARDQSRDKGDSSWSMARSLWKRAICLGCCRDADLEVGLDELAAAGLAGGDVKAMH